MYMYMPPHSPPPLPSPPPLLSPPPLPSPQGPPVWYSLYAVLVHLGMSCHSGHYFCFIKNSNNTWFSLNDAQVLVLCTQCDNHLHVHCIICTRHCVQYMQLTVHVQCDLKKIYIHVHVLYTKNLRTCTTCSFQLKDTLGPLVLVFHYRDIVCSSDF